MPAEKEKLKGEYTGRWNARFTLTLINNKKKRIFKRGFKSKKYVLTLKTLKDFSKSSYNKSFELNRKRKELIKIWDLL